MVGNERSGDGRGGRNALGVPMGGAVEGARRTLEGMMVETVDGSHEMVDGMVGVDWMVDGSHGTADGTADGTAGVDWMVDESIGTTRMDGAVGVRRTLGVRWFRQTRNSWASGRQCVGRGGI